MLDSPLQVDTPNAARTTKAGRKALQALHRNLDAFFDELPKPGGKAASIQETSRLQELLLAMPAEADSTGYGDALDYTRARISRYGAAELVDLLLSLSAHRKRDKICVEQLKAIVHCVQERLLSLAPESTATELASLDALASNGHDEAAALALRLKLAGLSDESLLAAAQCANPQLCLIAQEHVNAMQADGVRHLEAASTRLAAAQSEGGPPANLAELTSLLQDTVQALRDHERFSAIHGLPLHNKAYAVRLSLAAWLQQPLERFELPLHLATREQHQAICEALAVLPPMGAERPEDHFEAAYLSKSLACMQRGRLGEALNMLKLAQDMRPRAATGQRESLHANLLGQLLSRLPRDQLTGWAKVLDAGPIQLLMAALDEVGSKVFAGQQLGREIAQRHQDLQEIRAALGTALGARVPKATARFKDAIGNPDVRQALADAFHLQIESSPGEVEVFAKTGPVRNAAQAIFDEALQRDLTQKTAQGKKAGVEINGVQIAPGFLEATQRTSCRAFNLQSRQMEPVKWAGNPATSIKRFMEMTGATPAQMTTFTRIYDADPRIDITMLSPWSVLHGRSTTVFPTLPPDGQRNSQVRVKRDQSGNLLVRFVTDFTGIADVLPISGTQLLQPHAVAQSSGTAMFTHDIRITPDGTSSQARLERTYDLPAVKSDPSFFTTRRLAVQDLVANPDALRALGQMVDRQLGTRYAEYLDNVDALLGIPRHNISNLFSTAQGMKLTFIPDSGPSPALGISAESKDRVAFAINEAGKATTPASIDRVVDAFRATQRDVAQTVLDHAKALLAANSAVKS